MKFTKADRTSLPDKTPIESVKLFLHALFFQVDVSVNERAIYSSSKTCPYCAYIHTLLNFGEEGKENLLSRGYFYESKCLETTNPVQTTNVIPSCSNKDMN